jgi:AraC-like DNA-binding protein
LYEADENDPWEYCWIGFDGTDAEAILQTCGFTPENPVYNDNSCGMLKDALMHLVKAFDEGNANEYTYLGYLYLCLSYMRSDSLGKNSNIRPYLKQAMDYVQNNYTYDIKVSDIARFVGIDRTYLYKLFINELMTSPQQYLIDHRLHMAKNLLKKTDLSVTEIACSCGFKDAPAFYKHFRKRLGITPLKYRSDKNFFLS